LADVHPHGRHARTTRRLAWVLALTAGYAVAEVVGGLLSNSLALLADAGHMLTDIMALVLALVAAWTARRPPDSARTYGYQRVEILAALFNGVALVVIALFIFLEALERFREPPQVDWGLMAAIASGGLVINVVAILLLRGQRHGLNVRAAFLHVVGDLLGSVGALVAAGAIALFGWQIADPVASLVIAGIIVFGAVRLVLDAAHVLLEGVPPHLEASRVRAALLDVAGVCDVHDLHLWSLGGRVPLLTAHLVLDHSVESSRVLRTATDLLNDRFAIEHVTLQLEPPDYNVIVALTSAGEGDRRV